MNCQDFEKIINDLARVAVMEATQRTDGLAHADRCERCAARLRDERTLSGGLRSLALSVGQLEAPERVEAALLSAFRHLERATPGTTTIQPATPVAVTSGTLARNRWRWATAGIAAALVLLFVAFAAIRIQIRQGLQPAQLASAHDPQPLSVVWDSYAQGQQQAARQPSAPATGGRGAAQAAQFASLRTEGRGRHSMEGVSGNRSAVSGGTTAQPPSAMAYASAGGDGIATDFIPLTYGMSGTDGGHVVRVELPRTALAQFGLPVNAESSGEPVKADVLLGEDGLARAIRFVR